MNTAEATINPPGEAVRHLRAATAADHDAVDAVYAGFDLADRGSYARFLHAHALALPAVEAALAHSDADLPPWRVRRTMLAGDLAALGRAMPLPLLFPVPATAAAAWGIVYVAEGSRLGGAMLARQVGEGLPSRYLAARHQPGEWRALLAGFEAAVRDAAWLDAATTSARATFALYARAAASC